MDDNTNKGATESFAALLAQACAETLREGPRSREAKTRGPRKAPSNSHVLLRKAVEKLDADEVERLLAEGASVWPQDKAARGSIFDAWLSSARSSKAKASDAARVAIALDKAGAPMFSASEFETGAKQKVALEKSARALAQGGDLARKERLRIAGEWIDDWHRFGETAAKALGALWASWGGDGDEAARVSPADAARVAFYRKERHGALSLGFLGVIGARAQLSPAQWKDVAALLGAQTLWPEWDNMNYGLRAWEAEAALGLGGGGLDARTAGELARAAIRLDSPAALAKAAGKGPKEGFKLPAAAWADMGATGKREEGPPALAYAAGATRKRRDPQGIERGWACFDAMAKVPALVEESARNPAPEAFAALTSAQLQEVWEKFPEILGPNAQGDNALHFAAKNRWGDVEEGAVFCRRIFKCGMGAALAFEPNAQGEPALKRLRQIFHGERAAPAGAPEPELSWEAFLAGLEKKELKAQTQPPKRKKAVSSRL